MSGSGSSVDYGTGGGRVGGGISGGTGSGSVGNVATSCLDIRFQTQLSSPKPNVVAKLKADDLLEIHLTDVGPQVVVAVLYKGEVAGGLASPQIQRIRECLEQGTKFEAKVISKNEGQVLIDVFAVPPRI
jgi:hypothetical protein